MDFMALYGIVVRVILIWIFRKRDGCAWSGLIWLRIGINGGPL